MLTVLETLLVAVLIAVDIVASKWLGQQAYSWMPSQGTAEAKHVDDLFSFLVAVGAFIFLGIAAVIGYSILFYRAPKGDFSHGHPARGSWKIEVLWTVVPIGLVLWIAIQSNTIYQQLNIQGLTPIVMQMPMEEPAYAATVWEKVEGRGQEAEGNLLQGIQTPPEDKPVNKVHSGLVPISPFSRQKTGGECIKINLLPSGSCLLPFLVSDAKPSTENQAQPAAAQEIQVISKQWVWSFRYPGGVTSTELHLPVNRSIRLKLESQDVIHGFYIPEFRVKQDIIPNRTITFTVTPTRLGKYRLRDSSFSGPYLPLMEADVYVEPLDAYNRWLAQAATQTPTTARNPAFLEYTQQPQKALGDGWPVVRPAPPPVVHHPS